MKLWVGFGSDHLRIGAVSRQTTCRRNASSRGILVLSDNVSKCVSRGGVAVVTNVPQCVVSVRVKSYTQAATTLKFWVPNVGDILSIVNKYVYKFKKKYIYLFIYIYR